MNTLTFTAVLTHWCMDEFTSDGTYEITVAPDEDGLSLDSITIDGRNITNDLDCQQEGIVQQAIDNYEWQLRQEAAEAAADRLLS